MDETNSLMAVESGNYAPISVEAVKAHRAHVRDLIRSCMEKGVHYDTIPGTDKNALLQAGAESLAFDFRLEFGEPTEKVEDLGGDHRDFDCKVPLRVRGTGVLVAVGVGTCTTKEKKYRYRWDNTGVEVPKEYWDTRDDHFLGGPSFAPRKAWKDNKQGWYIFRKIEHEDPADYWNTCRRMAYKRAMVHAVRTGLGISEMFTDEEGMEAILADQPGRPAAKTPPAAPQPKRKAGRPKKANGKPPAGNLEEYLGMILEVEPRNGYHFVKTANAEGEASFSCWHGNLSETMKAWAGADIMVKIGFTRKGNYANIETAEKVED